MKRNAIGHMMAPKETAKSRLRRWDIFYRLLCLLLAISFWLLIVNAKNSQKTDAEVDIPLTQTVEVVKA